MYAVLSAYSVQIPKCVADILLGSWVDNVVTRDLTLILYEKAQFENGAHN
jgi:hypothetical protein